MTTRSKGPNKRVKPLKLSGHMLEIPIVNGECAVLPQIKHELCVYDMNGQLVRSAEFIWPRELDPLEAMDKAGSHWKDAQPVGQFAGVWIDFYIDDKLISGADL